MLESPTGTGKTLCLLCAALGWRRHRQQQVAEARTSWEKQAEEGAPTLSAGTPRIWYASRTHSQLKQVVAELKKTSYKPWSVVLGSREHFCVHTSVSRHTGASQNARCKRARDENRCPFYTGFKRGGSSKVNTSLLDIEEIVTACKEKMICPYFKCREDAKEAELLLIPYDYLINPTTRESMGVSLKDAILVFDEGHNIEKSCEQAASFELRSADIGGAITELDDAFDILESEGPICEEALGDMTTDQLMAHINLLKKNLCNLEDSLLAVKLSRDPTTERTMSKAPGSHILEIFGRSGRLGDGICAKDAQRINLIVRKAITVLTYSQDSTSSGGLNLDKLQSLLAVMFTPQPAELDKNYQVLVYEESEEEPKKGGTKRKAVDFFGDMTTAAAREGKPRTLCLWCFSCSVALQQLEQLGVHSLIVTSGTLSPMDGTIESFGVPFPVVLENKHVIDPSKQLWGGVISNGPDGVSMEASFKHCREPAYIRDLGKVVQNLASFVPDGLLIAFHSYKQKEDVLKAWRQSGLYDEITSRKPIFDEPKGNREMQLTMEGYSRALNREMPAGTGTGGAILAAVCRGKLCEGIDFTDRQCRMVIMVGIPYPNRNDLRVILKQSFLDSRGNQGDGRAWYTREAIRAVNQTLGRVIRHRNDFGGVLLCDTRYAKDGRLAPIARGLSSWLAPSVSVLPSFEAAAAGCRRFFGIAAPERAKAATPEQPKSLGQVGQPQAQSSNAGSGSSSATAGGGATASQAQSRATKKEGVSLSALGALWKSLKAGPAGAAPPVTSSVATEASARVLASPQLAGAALAAAAAAPVPAVADVWVPSRIAFALPATKRALKVVLGSQPAPPKASAAAAAPKQAAVAVGAQKVPPLAPPAARPAANVVAVSKAAKAWLGRAEDLLPRMELEQVRGQVGVLELQADIVAGGVPERAAAAEPLLLGALKGVAQSLLPEFCFDTPAEERAREALIRDCAVLLPRLLRPLWKRTVEDVLTGRGDARRLW